MTRAERLELIVPVSLLVVVAFAFGDNIASTSATVLALALWLSIVRLVFWLVPWRGRAEREMPPWLAIGTAVAAAGLLFWIGPPRRVLVLVALGVVQGGVLVGALAARDLIERMRERGRRRKAGYLPSASTRDSDPATQLARTLQELPDHLDRGDRDALFRDVRDRARRNPDRFASAVRKLPLDASGPLFEIYEALSGEQDAFLPFFESELDRLLREAAGANDPVNVLAPLEAFAFLDLSQKPEVRSRMVSRYARALDEIPAKARWKVIWQMGEFIERSDAKAVARLVELLRSTRWRERYLSHMALAEIDGVPGDYRLSWLDRWRARRINPGPEP